MLLLLCRRRRACKRGAHLRSAVGQKRAVSHHSFLRSRRWVGWRGSIESFCALVDGQEVWQSGQLSSPSLGAVGGGDGVGFHGARKSYCVRPSAPPRIDHRSCQREVSGSEQRIDSLPAQVKRERNFGHAAGGRTPKSQNTPRGVKMGSVFPSQTCMRAWAACPPGENICQVS